MAHITHVAFHVADIDDCIEFYRDFAHLQIVHERSSEHMKVVWLAAEPHANFVLVLLSGGQYMEQPRSDFSHLGFALESREAVDSMASKAEQAGCLVWPVVDEPYPTGHYCGVRDPNGHIIEFSFGQPRGAEVVSHL